MVWFIRESSVLLLRNDLFAGCEIERWASSSSNKYLFPLSGDTTMKMEQGELFGSTMIKATSEERIAVISNTDFPLVVRDLSLIWKPCRVASKEVC